MNSTAKDDSSARGLHSGVVRRVVISAFGLAVAAVVVWGCSVWAFGPGGRPVQTAYEIVKVFPHDPQAFCQGLIFHKGELYEGTGQEGQSTLRRVDLETGRVLQAARLSPQVFGEGITIWKDNVVQLTWKHREGYVWDKATFKPLRKFRYNTEGWGITHNGRHLIMSDGSSTLRFLDPDTFQVVSRIDVRSEGRLVKNLNELEYVNGEILANVWYEDYILRISPTTGKVLGWIDLSDVVARSGRRNRDEVLNGIAWDEENERLFVTGKNWPRLFEIKLTK